MATVIVRPQAERDLTSIGDRIAEDNPARAITFIAEIRAEGQALADFPGRRPVVPEIGPGGTVRAQLFSSEAEAGKRLDEIKAQKRRRGYELRYVL